MSNDTPPRACLADFGFMTIVFDPSQLMSCSAQVEPTFMSPELLMPSNFGIKNLVPTPQADIYAFGLVIYQVLTGEIPFRQVPQAELGYSLVARGLRPDKPENAATIGFSDSLWGFVQQCWRGNRDLRPRVSEAITHLEAAAMDWDRLMPPCVPADNTVSYLSSPSPVSPVKGILMASPSSPALQRLHRLDTSSPDFDDQLCSALYGGEYVQCLQNLKGDDLVWLADYLDRALNGLEPSCTASRKCLRELRYICGTSAILPTSYKLSPDLLSITSDPFASGGYGDVYHGTLNGSRICAKRVRAYIQDGPQKATKAFCKEAVMWKRLTHPNIVPLLGITTTPFQLISDWMSGGDLPGYIAKNPDVDRIGLLSDVTEGLYYLHSCNMIHGDLKGQNILVDDSGHARIVDFGFAIVTRNLDSMSSASHHNGYTPRWTAPEVLDGEPHSKEGDIFSFAMVMIEVFTGAVPFSDTSSFVAISSIMQGKRPSRPTHPTFTENLWSLMQRCWGHDPRSRPEVSEALGMLRTAAGERAHQPVLVDPSIFAYSPPCERLIRRAFAPHELPSLIGELFSSSDVGDTIRSLPKNDAQTFIDVISEVLDGQDLLRTRGKCLRSLYKACAHHGLLPKAMQISVCYDRTAFALYSGGYGDVWKGIYCGRDVAIKVLRTYSDRDPQKTVGMFCKEIVTWNFLRHPNVLPLLGVMVTENRFAMVSNWMINGNINDFIKACPDVNRLELLIGVSKGLVYVHSRGMIHGDLKGLNILIDQAGNARLADFGLVAIIPDATNPMTQSSCTQGGTVRWMSPELIEPQQFGFEHSRPTKSSDCYALGMVIYETISGHVPFHEYGTLTIPIKVLRGEYPRREVRFPDSLWEMLLLCWRSEPNTRPNVEDVLRHLERVANGSGLPSPMTGIEMGQDGDDYDSDLMDNLTGMLSNPLRRYTFSALIVEADNPTAHI
ncbi:kinase-like protein [Thelephora ganbajun]|uniref:Kinase-like protein n=1 Tax=Thelephora ganbajun TaxID=370292 RepID=A0ACB6Z4Q9_THEGA|nr:kinase-like protein [Thelephora ganbajun]